MSKTKQKPKSFWVKVGPGREKLVYGKAAEPRKGVPRHYGKELHGFHVNPEQSTDFHKEAVQAGIDVEFRGGKCFANGRRAQQEYAYFRRQDVNLDGGYYETISEPRKRELDRLAGRR